MNARQAAAPADALSAAIDDLPVSYIEIDARGAIARANRSALALHSEHQGELFGKFVWDLMPTEEKERSRALFFSLMESGEEPPVARRFVFTRSGEFRVHETHRNLIRDAEGRPMGMRVVSIDVTEAQRAQDEEHCARLWLESVLESMAEAVIVTDALGFIRTVNPAAEELTGRKAAELVGALIDERLPLLSYRSQSQSALSLSLVLDQRSKGVATMLDLEGREMRVEIGTSPIVDKDHGFTAGVVSVCRRLDAG